ncbi:MAG TPA: hypothetical protein VES19_12390, partial [Candidatus Limnocylindrales bacterium]|nr:hypothetical protein [Candidatus Limnocylindrales bacterium]
SGGKTLDVAAGTPGAAYRAVSITFPQLFFGESRTITLTYAVKGGKPRSQTATRTMRAFASFCAIANGVDQGSVTVRLPKGFAVTTTGEKLKARVEGKERILSSGKIKSTADWFACFTGTNAGGYKTEKLAGHDGRTIQLRSWPEDPAWAKGVRADIASGLPALERLAGAGLPGEAALNVQESATGTQYAGFYDGETGTVTVGEDYAQPALVEHELAHAWFNRTGFKETWLSEGLAEWAGRAVSGEAPACERPSVAAGSVSLATWRALGPQASPEEREAVTTQYAAACYAVTAVAEAAGEPGMTAAVSALLARRDPYGADASARRASATATWKDWLDAVDELALAPAGAGETVASDLLTEYGVATDAALLALRVEVRRGWRELVTATQGWTVPAAVRAPMAAWDFRAAAAAIASARRTWDLTGETDAVLAGVDARRGPAAEAWAAAGSTADLEAAADLAARQLAAARDVAEVRDLVASPLDVAQQVGLFGTQVPSIDVAIPAIRAGDGDEVARIAADIRATVAGLRAVGQQRMTVGAVVALTLLAGLTVVMVRRARADRLRRAEARASAATIAVAEARGRPQPWSANPLDDSPTRVWDLPLVASNPDPDLGSLVRKPARGTDTPPSDRGESDGGVGGSGVGGSAGPVAGPGSVT